MNGVWSSETSFRDRRFRLASVLVFGIAVAYPSEHSFAQTTDDHAMLAKRAVLTKLSTPIYPPLARQARISGEIDLALDICPDGTVGSVSVIRGRPMLRSVAVESAQRSQFECQACIAAVTSYPLGSRLNYFPLTTIRTARS